MNILRADCFIFAILCITVFYLLPYFGYDINPAPQDSIMKMRAIVYESHGGSQVLQIKEIPRPLANKSFVLVKVHAASLNPCDYKFRRNNVPGLVIPLPKIPGGDIAGVVEYAPVGSSYTIGERVAALVPLTGSRWGGYGEYYAAQEDFIARIPDGITFEQAASLPLVALTTLQGLEDIDDPSIKSILIHAGSGGVGTFAIQWAKNVMKFKTVAVTCSSRNHALVTALGADLAIDYRTEDFTKIVKNYDVVFDPMSYQYEQSSLTPGVIASRGTYINIVSSDFQLSNSGREVGNDVWTFMNPLLYALHRLLIDSKTIAYKTVLVRPNGGRLTRVLKEVASGHISPIIDSVYPLAQAAEAQDYLTQGRAVGKVVLSIVNDVNTP